MTRSCAIYAPTLTAHMQRNPFGKDVANLSLYRAFGHYLPGDVLQFMTHDEMDDRVLTQQLYPDGPAPKTIRSTSITNADVARQAGCLFRGTPNLNDLAWLRRQHGDRAYSLAGLVHSLAPPAMREYIAKNILTPTQPWDALICTSPSVVTGLRALFEETADEIHQRFGGDRQPFPQLPLIPLGVDRAGFDKRLVGTDARARWRKRLNLKEDDVAALWVGRLSFYEKAFPQSMFQSLEQAAQRSGKKLHFLMVGWFPAEQDKQAYNEAARALAPSVRIHYLDGNDQKLIGEIWAAADIFLSLVDNIQETFGMAPVEAMAAGLPCVVSDWDGYRSTVRHNRDGYRIPTLTSPPGSATLINTRHVLGMDGYQVYVGTIAQHTAVDVAAAADALTTLASDPEKRQQMGASGRQRVREAFDWPVVINQYAELFEELAAIRQTAEAHGRDGKDGGRLNDPIKGEPFALFQHFPTDVLSADTELELAPGVTLADLAQRRAGRLDRFANVWHRHAAAEAGIFERLRRQGTVSAGALVRIVEPKDQERVWRLLAWLCKQGQLQWRSSPIAPGAEDGGS